MIIISMVVTDGREEWLETQKYMWYTKREAQRSFKEHLLANGLKRV